MHGQRMGCWLVVITRSVELFVNYYYAILITLVVCDKIRLDVAVIP